MSERVDLGKQYPDVYQKMIALNNAIYAHAEAAGLAKSLLHLLVLRASQINQCSFCVRMHTRDALAAGESSDRIALVAAWRESEYFSDHERAALALVEAMTTLESNRLEAAYQVAITVLSKEQVAAVEWLAVAINSWNRIAIASHYTVKP